MARPVSQVVASVAFSPFLRQCLAPMGRATPTRYPCSDYYSVHARFAANKVVASNRRRGLRAYQGAHYVKRQSFLIKKHGGRLYLLLELRQQPQKLQWKDETRKITLPDFQIPTSIVGDLAPSNLFSKGALKMKWIRIMNKHVSETWLSKHVCTETLLSKYTPLAPPLLGPTLVNSTRDEVDRGKDVQASEGAPEQSDKATPAQLSFVLLKLREELPSFFHRPFRSDLYERNLVFENRLMPFACTLRGFLEYSLFLNVLKWSVIVLFSRLKLNLIKITKDVDESKVEARWRVEGTLRMQKSRERVILEGFSTFEVNSNGRICKHVLDKVMRTPKEERQVGSWLAQLGIVFGLVPKPSQAEPI